MALLRAHEVQELLEQLSYWRGPLVGVLSDEAWRVALRLFQDDSGLVADGWYGPKTDAVARGLRAKYQTAQSCVGRMRRFRLTHYYIADEAHYPGPAKVPVYGLDRRVLARVTPRMFAAMSLEGTGKMKDGRLLNVTGKPVSVKAADYRGVLAVAKANRWIPDKPGYAGIVLDESKSEVAAALSFAEVPAAKRGEGYGTLRGVPLRPYRTLAADIGHPRYRNVEPRFKGKGGVCPPGTEVFILHYVGCKLPDGSAHDGWFVVNDTGGGIFGAHFDVFVGTAQLAEVIPHPRISPVWFDGIEKRLEPGYSYGL